MPRKRKQPQKPAEVEKDDESPATASKKKLLVRIHDRFKVMSEADDENRREGIEDQKFVTVPGYQWTTNMKQERGDRPCYEFNKLRINGKRVINEIRANRPQGKVRAVEGGDKETAELYEGLCRNIANISDFDTITDQAAEYQVDCGMGAWRLNTRYAADDVFDQDIIIEPIKNPLCLYADPACKDVLKRDAEDWILTERISNKAYESKYGKAEKVSFEDGEFDDEETWNEDETVRIVEYWYKEPYDKEIWLVEFAPNAEGEQPRQIAVDSTSDEAAGVQAEIKAGAARLVRTRTARCHKIMMCIASGDAVLGGPVERPGSQFPFVIVYGEYKVVDGKTKWHGLHRFSKDAQRSYNVSRTSIDETIAGAPKEYFWATPDQAKGHVEKWSEAHRKNFPFKLYNADGKANGGGPPTRVPGADVPVALMQQAIMASDDIRDTSGLHEASFGEDSPEKSGIALARKQQQAGVVTYNFPDNMAKGVRRTWEIMIDWIPEVYDAERELRVIGADGAEDYKRVNELVFDPASGKTIRVNDLAAGKYDVTVTTGPSFATLRQEAAEIYPQLYPPESPLYPFVADLVAKAQDHPYSEEISKRLQLAAPPAVQKMIAGDKKIPPEAQAALNQAEQAMQVVQQQTELIKAAAAEVQQDQATSEKAKAEVNTALANLKTAQAQFETKIAQAEAALVQREADLALEALRLDGRQQQLDGQQQQNEAGGADLSEAKQAVAAIVDAVREMDKVLAQTMQHIQQNSGVTIAMPKPARLKSARTVRENGSTVVVPEYDGDHGGTKPARVRMSRGADGSLVGTPEYEDQMAVPAGIN